jgi:16S rRNA (guanine527-N7)-methyltransferase
LIPSSLVLLEVLDEAQRQGLLGPRPIEEHLAAVAPMADWLSEGSQVVDLGAGGGVPALPLALAAPTSSWSLLDRRPGCCDFLSRAIVRLGLDQRVRVVCGDVTELARLPEWRPQFDVVVSRGFARPSVMLECAAPFLKVGGLVLATARGDDTEWPGEPGAMDRLGLDPVPAGLGPATLRVARQIGLCPPQFPRRRLSTS